MPCSTLLVHLILCQSTHRCGWNFIVNAPLPMKNGCKSTQKKSKLQLFFAILDIFTTFAAKGKQKNIKGLYMKVEHKAKDNPRLERRVLADGRESLYLEYYLGRQSEPMLDEQGEQLVYDSGKLKGKPKYKVRHIRQKEVLNLYILHNPRTPEERQQNRSTMEIAKRIRYEREQELLESREGYRVRKCQRVDFLAYFQEYLNGYTKKDKRMIQIAFNRFKDFLADKPEYNKYVRGIEPQQITREMIVKFTEYLQSRSRGEGAKTIYSRFKKVVNRAIDEGLMIKNPCKGISITIDEHVLRKDVLSEDEIATLIATHYQGENTNIRRAFIFCLYCGLRYCDIKDLTYRNVDYANKVLRFEQSKTKGHSASSGVVVPLNNGLLRLIGEATSTQSRESLIFPLPSYEMCLKALRHWTKRAGIEKHITWHCARHSFAVNVLNNGANIKTVASLLGHSGLRHTEKYTRAIDSLKQEAINSLQSLDHVEF